MGLTGRALEQTLITEKGKAKRIILYF